MKFRKIDISNYAFLSQIVHDVYELTNVDEIQLYSTIPNGIIGISIVLSGEHQILYDNCWHKSPLLSIYGLVNKPDVIKSSKNFREIAIGFNPYYMQLLLNNSMHDIAGGTNKNAFDFFHKEDLNILYENIYLAKNDFQILSSIQAFLLKQVISSKINPRLNYAINLLYKHELRSVSELSKSINLSTVSVRTLFKDCVGQSPKEIIKILRIYKALKVNPQKALNLTQLSYQLGYFDQSHFIHDFKQFFGASPSSYFKQAALTFDFYNYGRWKGNIFDKI